jgi:hypothetical protein
MPGKPVADLSLPSTGNTMFQLSDARGSKLALHIYPKHNILKFPFELSDEDQTDMYGRKVRGIVRSTCLGVRVPGHVQEVLHFAQAL